MKQFATGSAGATTIDLGESDPLRELLRRLTAGDRTALAELYDRTARLLFGYAFVRTASPGAAEEVVQETFVRLVTTRADLAAARHPRAYLLAVVRRAAVDLARRDRRVEALDAAAELQRLGNVADDPGPRLDAQRAVAALAALPVKLREAVHLRYIEELSLREVASATGVPLFTAASRCRLGLARLRRILEGRSR